MFVICWITEKGSKWETVTGESEMFNLLSRLIAEGIDAGGILVFNFDDRVKNEYHYSYKVKGL